VVLVFEQNVTNGLDEAIAH